ncbi:MAG: sigma 54-interacting transcriptional regulator [Syntrophobacteraceae bacterium]
MDEKPPGLNGPERGYVVPPSEEGLWDWDLRMDSFYASPRYREIFGLEGGASAGSRKAWEDMLHPEDRAGVLARLANLVEGGVDYCELRYRFRTRAGRTRSIVSRAIVVERGVEGIPSRVVGTVEDVTERLEMEESLRRAGDLLKIEVEKRARDLREANRKLETILDLSSESIWVCDGTGKVLSINRAAEILLGVPAGKVVGKNIREIVDAGLVDRSATIEALEKKKPVTLLQYVKETQRCLLVTGTPVFDADGSVTMVIVNDRDLTRLNELQEELQKARSVSREFREKLTEMNLLELKNREVIAESRKMQQVLATGLKLAHLQVSNILLLGESGTGKGLLAKFIHSHGKGRDKPFVQINCAALPEPLLEAELFGYERGAFTGAHEKGKAGLFELAQGGTLFLDEVGELPLTVQAKLLKCLEEREVMHLGGLEPIRIDCTVIAATNADLADLVRKRLFRNDLFFRLNAFPVKLPPLRNRPEDIFELTRSFLKKYNEAFRLNRRIGPRGFKCIRACPFPGNVRELENSIKKAVVMSDRDLLDDFIEEELGGADGLRQEGDGFREASGDLPGKVDALEREILVHARERYRTTRALAAHLGLSQSAVIRRLKKHGLSGGRR